MHECAWEFEFVVVDRKLKTISTYLSTSLTKDILKLTHIIVNLLFRLMDIIAIQVNSLTFLEPRP